MQIYGYPGERVDFVSRSGSAGSIMFGDPKKLCLEFFGPAHREDEHSISYFNGSVSIDFLAGKVAAIHVTPGASSEKIDVFLVKEKLNLLTQEEATELLKALPVDCEFANGNLQRVSFNSQ